MKQRKHADESFVSSARHISVSQGICKITVINAPPANCLQYLNRHLKALRV